MMIMRIFSPVLAFPLMINTKDIPTYFFADQLTEEDVIYLIKLFKITSDTTDRMEALHIYLQKYPFMHTRDEWEALVVDIGFIDDTPNLTLAELQFHISQFIQKRTDFGLIATNGSHHIA
jgi:hypothetical protein